MSNTNEEETLVAADIDLATFDGSTPIDGALGTQQCGVDPATQDQIVTIKEPLGGWRFETTRVTNLPQTIFGMALLSNDLATLLGYERFDVPITLTASGQVINPGVVNMRMVAQPMS